jgi:hypothetical protein
MTNSGPYVDPQAIALLQEVALNPQSSLLKIKRPQAFAAAAGMGKDVLARSLIGLTSAEKDLLLVYRDEVAYLLRVAYYERAGQVQVRNNRGHFYMPPRNRDQERGAGGIVDELERLAPWQGSNSEPTIEAAISAVNSTQSSMLELASLSQRFSPGVPGLIYLVDEFLESSQGVSARATCSLLLERSLSEDWRAPVAQKLAMSWACMGNFAEAARQQGLALSGLAPDASGALNWASYSLVCGDGRQAQAAIRYLDTHWPEKTPAIQARLDLILIQARTAGWRLSREALALTRSVGCRSGHVSSEIAALVLLGNRRGDA